MGSKASMLPTLDGVLRPLIRRAHREIAESGERRGVVFGDMFAGSGCVANHYKKDPLIGGIVSCDTELYSYIISNALLKTVYTKKLSKIVAHLNGPHLVPHKGLIWRHFAPNNTNTQGGRRMFFTLDNAQRIDAIRTAISRMHRRGAINYKEFTFLLASLMTSCSKYANVASCFRAYLKSFCDRSKRRFVLAPIHMTRTRPATQRIKVVKNDVLRVVEKHPVDVAYIDPPYNANHYGGYYSFYNYLAVYSPRYAIHGVAGVTKHYNKSEFGFRATAREALRKLVDGVRGARFMIMSYNSDGVVPKEEVVKILAQRGDVTLYKMWNKKFRPHQGVQGTIVKEFIFVVECHQNKERRVREVWLSRQK